MLSPKGVRRFKSCHSQFDTMLTDKQYAEPEQIREGTSETVGAKIIAVDVTGQEHTKQVTLVYDKEMVESADVLQDLNKEITEEFKEKDITLQFEEKLFTDQIVRFQVKRAEAEY